jgi:multicomponent Na+:H+ antiporter subunit D
VSPETAILLSLGIPLVGALLIALTGRQPNLREGVTLATAVLMFGTVVALVPGVMDGGRPEATLIEMLPGLPLHFEVEPLGMLFALVASGLWIVTSVYSIGYMRGNKEKNQTRFYVCFAIALASTMGVAFAGNMLTLFVFYEALTLSTYPLVAHKGDEAAKQGGRTYLGILLFTSIGLQLLAILWTWQVAGTLDFTLGGILAGKASDPVVGVLLLLYMYGIGKAALMPFHRWLPAAMVAPTPVSALLHAVAVVKAGVFTVMKVVVYIFGVDFLASTGTNDWLLYIAAFTLLAASLVAMTKDNLKARLAYSTVSQLAYVVLGAALATSWGVIGGSMHIAMHAMGKITLFFCAGAIYTAAHKTEVSEMAGLGRVMPVTFGAFLIGALSIIGLPPLGGSWSKWYLMLGAAEADQLMMIAVLMVSSLLNVAYLVPVAVRGFLAPLPAAPAPAAAGTAAAPQPRFREAPMFCLVPLSLTALGCLALFFFADPIYRLLAPIAG